uniref:Uncharacterized protein n=1 Tax=Trypanosoma congolense (strain IL3000) TaxID=1068625 RepID=G0UTG4_TRYCI|nr:hypothetical protein, unlikely [Trypanosoma congolense IL3000]
MKTAALFAPMWDECALPFVFPLSPPYAQPISSRALLDETRRSCDRPHFHMVLPFTSQRCMPRQPRVIVSQRGVTVCLKGIKGGITNATITGTSLAGELPCVLPRFCVVPRVRGRRWRIRGTARCLSFLLAVRMWK